MTDPQSNPSTRILLVRHGQSVANAGGIVESHDTTPLTQLGHTQAQAFAETFSLSPTLFIRSPFLRAQQTSEPLIQRFPDVPVEDWPIHEFTYLEPSRHNGTHEEQQLPHIHAYWERGDPDYLDGPAAESFTLFLDRARNASNRLAQMDPQLHHGGCIIIFTHGLLMQAVRMLLLFPHATDAELMSNFRRFHFSNFIENTEPLELEAANGQLRIIGQQHLTAFTLQGEPSHV